MQKKLAIDAIDKAIEIAEQLIKSCGAGNPGSPGFENGNTCNGEGGGATGGRRYTNAYGKEITLDEEFDIAADGYWDDQNKAEWDRLESAARAKWGDEWKEKLREAHPDLPESEFWDGRGRGDTFEEVSARHDAKVDKEEREEAAANRRHEESTRGDKKDPPKKDPPKEKPKPKKPPKEDKKPPKEKPGADASGGKIGDHNREAVSSALRRLGNNVSSGNSYVFERRDELKPWGDVVEDHKPIRQAINRVRRQVEENKPLSAQDMELVQIAYGKI
jgi:hypothetical protein